MQYRAVISALLGAVLALFAPLPASTGDAPATVSVTAKKFEYNPATVTLKQGAPAVLEFTSLDRLHGFSCPDLGIRTDITPGEKARVELTPKQAGKFLCHCDIFCGDGHEDMFLTIEVTP